MIGVLMKRGPLGTETDVHRGRLMGDTLEDNHVTRMIRLQAREPRMASDH